MRLRHALAVLVAVAACDSTEPQPPELARRLAVGEQTVCALVNSGGVRCWGANTNFYEYGAPAAEVPTSSGPASVPVPALSAISAGSAQFTCGIAADAKGVCWGRGGFGQMGTGTLGSPGNRPVSMSAAIRWKSIAVGRLVACGVDESEFVHCWGHNQRGEVGIPTTSPITSVTSPTPIATTAKFSKVSVGWLHSCGLTTTNDIYCWGSNADGQLGIGASDTLPHGDPAIVPGGTKWIDVATSSRSTCAIATDGAAWCWGFNFNGQLGDNSTTTRHAPTPVATTERFIDIEMSSGFGGGGSQPLPAGSGQASYTHTCGLRTDSTAVCWGLNHSGQLGDSTMTDRHAPVTVGGGLKFAALGLGGAMTCGMNGDYIWCWGANAFGQLGNLTSLDSRHPVKVAAPFMKP